MSEQIVAEKKKRALRRLARARAAAGLALINELRGARDEREERRLLDLAVRQLLSAAAHLEADRYGRGAAA